MSVTPRILVVEDDPSQARLLELWLGRAGYAPTVVDTGSAASDRLRDGGWALVLSDVDLPGSSGLDVLREAKRVTPTTPAVLMTAHGAASLASEAIARGVDSYLLKPLARGRLLDAVAQLLARPANAQTVLAIGWRTSDLAVACGATLGLHAERGDAVHLLVLGDSTVRTSPLHFPFAGRIHGDLDTPNAGAVYEVVSREVAQLGPSLVYLPTSSPGIEAVLHRASRLAARSAEVVYAYAPARETDEFRPQRFRPISDQLPGKLAWMAGLGFSDESCERARRHAIRWGSSLGVPCEVFELVRDVRP
ncbi:MAG: response regulator [Deltaproteobacteria bacterium]|nr:MAG: response regulator [Deltaproteobacteria bacterium]